MKSKAAVRRIVEELKVLYPNARCSLEYKKDYELLFAVRLSAQCTDARVNMVTPSLYQKFPTLVAFANATYEEVGDAIRSCGFYNTKSKDIVECSATCCTCSLRKSTAARSPARWRSSQPSPASGAKRRT